MDKKVLAKIMVVVVIVFAVFTGLNAYFDSVDLSVVPEGLQPAFTVLFGFFDSGVALFAVALIRNVSGYIYEYAQKSGNEVFLDTKLYGTIVYYVGIVGAVSAVLPDPYREVGVAVLVVLDVVKQALKELWKK